MQRNEDVARHAVEAENKGPAEDRDAYMDAIVDVLDRIHDVRSSSESSS